MLIGYARTSTVDQLAGLEAQLQRLSEVGCERVFQERVSSVAKRDQLAATLDYARDGDVVVVTKLDRLARSVADLVDIGAKIEAKGASLRVLDTDLDAELETRIRRQLRDDCSPRHVPDEIRRAPEVPRTLSGKLLEVPVKRILLGADPGHAASRDSLANPAALDWFIQLAGET